MKIWVAAVLVAATYFPSTAQAQHNTTARTPSTHTPPSTSTPLTQTIDTTATGSNVNQSTGASTSTSGTTSTAGCPAAEACRAHPNCTLCVAALVDATGLYSDPRDDDFVNESTVDASLFRGLESTAACGPDATPPQLLGPALEEVTRPLFDEPLPCAAVLGLVVDSCASTEYACFGETECAGCLSAVYRHTVPYRVTFSSPACRSTNLSAISEQCAYFPQCSLAKHLCANDAECRGCWARLRAGNGAAAVTTCANSPAGSTLLQNLVEYCTEDSRALCGYHREVCAEDPACGLCLAAMEGGGSTPVVAAGWRTPHCDAARASYEAFLLLNTVLMECIRGVSGTCAKITADCVTEQDDDYGTAGGDDDGDYPYDDDLNYSDDDAAAGNTSATDDDGDGGTGGDSHTTQPPRPPACSACLAGEVPANQTAGCAGMLASVEYSELCAPCSKSVGLINRIASATAVVGWLSLGCTLWVVLSMLARRRDRGSIRDRVILGLMLANALFAAGNSIEVNSLHTDPDRCGQLALRFETIRTARSVWFAGKFGLVACELVVVVTSLWALRRGTAGLTPCREALLHLACLTAAAAAFAAFYTQCLALEPQGYNTETEAEAVATGVAHLGDTDDSNAIGVGNVAAERFDAARAKYNELVRDMLLAWDGLLGVTIALWLALRLGLHRAFRRWKAVLAEVDEAEAADDWAATRRSAWRRKRAVIAAQRAGVVDLARPLEPFVVLFVLFAAPAVVMSTEECQRRSGVRISFASSASFGDHAVGSRDHGTCDVWCELALAFRALGTVLVYAYPRQRRRELCDPIGTVLGAWSRLTNRGVEGDGGVGGGRRGRYARMPLGEGEGVELADLTEGTHGTMHLYEAEGDLEDEALDAAVAAQTTPEIAEADVHFDTLLGEGAFGAVWAGRWLGAKIAIKLLFAGAVDEDGDPIDPEAEADFIKECGALSRLKHPCLLRLFGVGIEGSGRRFLVTELMAGGSLEATLHDSTVELPWRSRISFALQVASGMEHLHNIPLIHRDLKSANVLLDGRGRAVVGDFGTSRQVRKPKATVLVSSFTGVAHVVPAPHGGSLDPTDGAGAAVPLRDVGVEVVSPDGKMTKATGTMLWMAPEVYRGDQDYGASADVYSYGILLYELATRSTPWDELSADDNPTSQAHFFTRLNTALQQGQRPAVPASLEVNQSRFIEVMRMCWAGDSADRPPFEEIVPVLAACLRSASSQQASTWIQ